jgi:glycosyltransferase involved in cell wall biosynthesis
MNVMIAAVAASDHLSGVSRHAANLAQCLLMRAEVAEVHLVIGVWQYQSMRAALANTEARLRIHQVDIDRGAMSRNLWYFNRLPKLAAQYEMDIVHLAYPAPLQRSAFDCPTVVTLHDMYPYDIPSNFGFPKMLFNRAILRQCLAAVDAVACVSNSTLRRLDIHAPGIALAKAVTIYNSVDAGPPMSQVSPLPNWSGEPFLLCVAQHRRNKNIVLAMQVFERLLRAGDVAPEMRLVVLGIEGPETPRVHRFIRNTGLAANVTLLQGISDAELSWCYTHCELLLAPSIIEGFGLPIVEAMMHRCRVVCSDIPAFREVGGSYCQYAELHNDAVGTFVEAMRIALKSHRFRAAATECFSLARIAEGYIDLYSGLQQGSAAITISARNNQVGLFERGPL